MKVTRDYTEDNLNEMGIPEADKASNGGRIPDHFEYGTWLRKNDVIAFELAYNELKDADYYHKKYRRAKNAKNSKKMV